MESTVNSAEKINNPADNPADNTKWFSSGTKFNNSCLDNASPLEPIFILRAQDASSPKVILHWIAKNFETCPPEKLRDAFEHALRMREWPNRKEAD